MKNLILETFNLSNYSEEYQNKYGRPFTTKSGKQPIIIYIDKTSTNDTYACRDLFPKYGMDWLPNKLGKYVPHAWGWILWDGENDKKLSYIKKFGEEIGEIETNPEFGEERTLEEVIANLSSIREYILNAPNVEYINVDAICGRANELKSKLMKGLGSEEVRNQMQKLLVYRREMAKHISHPLSMMNTLIAYLTKPSATDIRSEGEWKAMGYTPKDDAIPIILTRPGRYKSYSKEAKKQITNKFLLKKGVNDIKDLTKSQEYDLKRQLRGVPDYNAMPKGYIAYDISDMNKGEGAEEFPVNEFDWYDKISDETERDKMLIDACIAYGKSIGIKDYTFKTSQELGRSRGYADSQGYIAIVDDKRNHGLLSTTIHETAHQIMHWEIVKNASPRLEKFYRGGSALRGKQIVEQEAELCAWVVLCGLGYEMVQHFNYLTNWGMTEQNCCDVFDQICSVADEIYNGMKRFAAEENNNNITNVK